MNRRILALVKFSETLGFGTGEMCPDNASRNFGCASRNPVPVAKCRFVHARRFLGQCEHEGWVCEGVEAGPEAGAATWLRQASRSRRRRAVVGEEKSALFSHGILAGTLTWWLGQQPATATQWNARVRLRLVDRDRLWQATEPVNRNLPSPTWRTSRPPRLYSRTLA